ncbi:hypothetical protein [Archangium sp.]|jgi:hypothetical protein|uniref:hypothetical protein n=1 Tax=Archangium sp. TaxID=1872627 RepID=UPI002EDBADF9
MIGTRLSEPQDALPPLRAYRRERAPDPNTLLPVSEDIRRQLEGGIETLEAAHTRYVLLEKALQQKQWQEEVLARLELLTKQVRQEPDLVEALARIRQRRQVEGWPAMEPALVLARKVEKLRSRLDALMRERLGGPTTREPFAEKLARLHQVLAQTVAPPVSSEERVLHHGVFDASTPLPMQPLLRVLGYVVLIPLSLGLNFVILFNASIRIRVFENFFGFMFLATCVLMLGRYLSRWFLACLWELYQRRRSGRFWLTGKRLVWQPTGKDPLHIPLHAILPGGVRLRSAGSVRVRLVDGRTFRLDFLQGAERLVSLLEQHLPASRPEAS